MNEELTKELSRLQLSSSRCKNKISMCPLSITKEENRAYIIFNYIKDLKQENKDLKEKNEFLMKRDNKCQILEQVINKTLKTINELKTTGWVNGENGTTTGYTYAKPCCKTRLNIIEDILREVE